MGGGLTIRAAREGDLDALVAIEAAGFTSDRATPRQFLHAVRAPTIALLVADRGGTVEGYASVEFRRGARVARLASIAVAPASAGRGVGRALLQAAEGTSRARGCDRLRLEVRADNGPAQHLYAAAGYTRFTVVDDYYEDGASAWRYERRLA